MRIQYLEDTFLDQKKTINGMISHVTNEVSLCKFFANGVCNKGSQCVFSHSLQTKRPVCKFFLSFQGCRHGDACFFSHDPGQSVLAYSRPSFSLPEDGIASSASFLQLLPTTSDGCILVFNDTDLRFTSRLSCHVSPEKMIATTSQPYGSLLDASSMDFTVLWGLCYPPKFIIDSGEEILIPWREIRCILWFADFSVSDEDFDFQCLQLRKFFEFLAIRLLADTLFDVRVILTMNNIRFSQLQVERLGRECFFFLSESFRFDESHFGEFTDRIITKKPMTISMPISYVFDMLPPTDLQFGDYSAVLRKGICSDL